MTMTFNTPFLTALMVLAMFSNLFSEAPVAASASPNSDAAALPRHSAIVTSMKRAADYYRGTRVNTPVLPTNGWSWSTYTQGIHALYTHEGDAGYLADGLAWGRSNAWGISSQVDPDSLKAAETYYDLHALDSSASLSAGDAKMASDLKSLPPSQYDWVDALFMGLPDHTRWARRTGNPAYLDKMDACFAYARNRGGTSSRCSGRSVPQPGLYDAGQKLWYRDCRFVGTNDANGKPIFWGRGNGWVIASMAQVIASLPPGDTRAATYATMLRGMAARLVTLQGADGLWRASLADPALFPQPETSGSALITYALAYGVRVGLLDAPTYLPAVERAWRGLNTVSLKPSGFLTGCQAVGYAPAAPYTGSAPRRAATATSAGTVNNDSPPFCVGAFLLAGSEVAQLTRSPSTDRPVVYTSQQKGNEAGRVNDGNVSTRWSAEGFPQSVTIDLKSSHRLSNAMVVPYRDRAYQYRIETSTDKVHWQLSVDRTSNTRHGTRLDDFTPGAVSARYVRLTVTGVHGSSSTWVSVREFAVYDR